MLKVQQTESIEKQLWKTVMRSIVPTEDTYSMQLYTIKSVVKLFKNMSDTFFPKFMSGEVRVEI